MISPPSGWPCVEGVHLLTYTSPDGRSRLRCFERLPLRPVPELCDRILAHDPEFEPAIVHEAAQVITDEGEYGVLVTAVGLRHGRLATHRVGIVLAEDFAYGVDGLATTPEVARDVVAQVGKLVQGLILDLGVRPRRFLYDAPAGWLAVASGLTSIFRPSHRLDERVRLIVHPARPVSVASAMWFGAFLRAAEGAGFRPDGFAEQKSFETDEGVSGNRFVMAGSGPRGRTWHDVIVLEEERFRYMFRLECGSRDQLDAVTATLERTARSLRALPAAASGAPTTAVAVDHWAL